MAELEEQGEGRLKEKLLLIRRELMHGFAEARGAFRPPDEDEEFLLLSGETDDTLALGRVVTATVRRVMPVKVLCVLESGLPAVIDKRDFSDEDVELERVVKSGSVVTGRIKEVKRSVYEVRQEAGGREGSAVCWIFAVVALLQWMHWLLVGPALPVLHVCCQCRCQEAMRVRSWICAFCESYIESVCLRYLHFLS